MPVIYRGWHIRVTGNANAIVLLTHRVEMIIIIEHTYGHGFVFCVLFKDCPVQSY